MKTGKNSNLKIAFPELRGSLDAMKYPAFVEPKYDGELNIWDGKQLINKYGKTRCDFPAVNNLPASCTLIGELYYKDGKAGRLYDLLKHKEDDDLNFKVFDIIGHNISTTPLLNRREMLFELVPFKSIIECELAYTKSDVNYFAQQYVNQGYEGVVVKSIESQFNNGPCAWVKIKHKDQTDYKVVLVDSTLERIEIEVPTPQILNSGSIRVGCKCPNRYKVNVKVGDMVTIEHQGVLASGSLRHPVFVPKGE